MKRLALYLCSLLMATMLLAGTVSVGAVGTPPDPNPTQETLGLSELRDRYDRSTHVKDAAGYDWPDFGLVWIESYQKYSFFDPVLLNGITIPANLIVDVYDRIDGSNNFRFLVRYDTTDGKPITITDIDADIKRGGPAAGFNDVSANAYYADAVTWAAAENITQGTGGNAFSPQNTVTRAEAVTFLWRAAGSPAPTAVTSGFSDVTDTHAYYYKAVLWAVEQGITNGTGGGRFHLTGTLSYDQIFTFLCRFAGKDAAGSDWSSSALAWAEDIGLTEGLNFTAKADCPRSDVVYCLWKQLSGEGSQATEQQPDLQGARTAIINALLQEQTQINIKEFGLEASQAEALMAEITHVDQADFGSNAVLLTPVDPSNYYNVRNYRCPQLEGQTAWTLVVNYIVTSEETLYVEYAEAVSATAKQVVAQTVTAEMSDYDIAKALHDYLVLNCAYSSQGTSSHSSYGALVEHAAVCQGYAYAYKYLMDEAGIPCKLIFGFANGYHAWNQVQINGEWYHVDTTWDDPTPNREGYVRYNYFLKSDNYMRRNQHTEWYSGYPCISTKYDNANLPDSFER